MDHSNDKTLIAIKKAQTLLGKIHTMLEEKKYCIDIIQQNLAIIGLLKSMNLNLLEGHVNHCVKNAIKANDDERVSEMMDELMLVMKTAQKK